MKKPIEQHPELKLQLIDLPVPRARRTWLPGAQFAVHQLDTRRWSRAPANDLDWQRTPSWHPRQRLN